MGIEITFIIILLFISGLFSGSESAIFSLESSTLDSLKKSRNNKIRAKGILLKKWIRNPQKILFTILLTNLVVNVSFTKFFDVTLRQLLPNMQNFHVFSLVVISVTILLFAEILPKVFAIQMRKKWSLKVVPFLNVWNLIIQKVFFIFRGIEESINRYFPEEKVDFQEEDILDALEESEKRGMVSKAEKEKLHRYVVFQSDTAYSAMIPRSLVSMLPEDCPTPKAKRLFQKIQLKELAKIVLIYRESNSKILGYLHIKNFVKIYYLQKTIKSSIQPILHIPATMLLKNALEKFRESNKEIGIVLSEDGAFLGILTLNITLQRLMGNFTSYATSIAKEHYKIVSNKKNHFQIPGNLLISSFNKYFRSKFSSKSAETIAGLILKYLDGFPEYSTKITIKDFLFTSFYLKNNKIISCEVQLLKK